MAISGGLLVLGLWVAFSWVTRRRVYRTVATSEAALDSAGLVPGTSITRVAAVLDSMHAIHGALGPDQVIGARIGPSFQDFILSGDIHAEFKFDSTGRLVSRHVRERLTGP
ncbi:MAG: hypothetical protein JWO05_1035 [Gemmatimonadetes bacterium]|nr:hypothetical protein [Gemmatimonadota bacterium]